jgi:hypothetical protein
MIRRRGLFILSTQYSALYLYSPLRVLRRSILTALMRPSFFYFTLHHYERLYFIVIQITLHHYERLYFIVTRDYTSLLREITLHCYERLHFIVTRDLVFELYKPPSIFTVGLIRRRGLFILSTHYSALYLYSTRLRRRYRRSILTAFMRPSLFIR